MAEVQVKRALEKQLVREQGYRRKDAMRLVSELTPEERLRRLPLTTRAKILLTTLGR